MDEIRYAIDGPPPAPAEISDLRESVGWDRDEADYPDAFRGYDHFVTARLPDGPLVGFCAVLTDGVRHAFLVDVIVRAELQRRGIGREVVRTAVEAVRARGVTIVHVDFTPENTPFYERCGFRPSRAGILELSTGPAPRG